MEFGVDMPDDGPPGHRLESVRRSAGALLDQLRTDWKGGQAGSARIFRVDVANVGKESPADERLPQGDWP
jgi:hypothetical protein